MTPCKRHRAPYTSHHVSAQRKLYLCDELGGVSGLKRLNKWTSVRPKRTWQAAAGRAALRQKGFSFAAEFPALHAATCSAGPCTIPPYRRFELFEHSVTPRYCLHDRLSFTRGPLFRLFEHSVSPHYRLHDRLSLLLHYPTSHFNVSTFFWVFVYLKHPQLVPQKVLQLI